MSDVIGIAQAIADYTARHQARGQAPKYVNDWEAQLPPGSKWHPGSIGHPECQSCWGQGYVSLNVPAGDPCFGKLFVCECATGTVDRHRADRLAVASGLMATDVNLSWDDKELRKTNDLKMARRAIMQTMRRGWGWVWLHGSYGPGKTLALKTAVAEVLRAGQAAHFTGWADMLEYLRQGYDAGDYDRRVEDLRGVRVLALDEMGRARDTDWASEVEGRVLNHRYERAIVAHDCVTLFAANLPPESSGVSAWLSDRVMDERFARVEMAGPSQRRVKG